jgi:hypothetical protein
MQQQQQQNVASLAAAAGAQMAVAAAAAAGTSGARVYGDAVTLQLSRIKGRAVLQGDETVIYR